MTGAQPHSRLPSRSAPGLVPMLVSALIVMSASLLVAVPPASARMWNFLLPGQVERLAGPGVALGVPAGAGRVLSGEAFTRRAGLGAGVAVAAPGAELAVLHLVVRSPSERAEVDYRSVPVPLILGPPPSDLYLAVAVPEGAPVVLKVSGTGPAVTVDLRARLRMISTGHTAGDGLPLAVAAAVVVCGAAAVVLAAGRRRRPGAGRATRRRWLFAGRRDGTAVPAGAWMDNPYDPASGSG